MAKKRARKSTKQPGLFSSRPQLGINRRASDPAWRPKPRGAAATRAGKAPRAPRPAEIKAIVARRKEAAATRAGKALGTKAATGGLLSALRGLGAGGSARRVRGAAGGAGLRPANWRAQNRAAAMKDDPNFNKKVAALRAKVARGRVSPLAAAKKMNFVNTGHAMVAADLVAASPRRKREPVASGQTLTNAAGTLRGQALKQRKAGVAKDIEARQGRKLTPNEKKFIRQFGGVLPRPIVEGKQSIRGFIAGARREGFDAFDLGDKRAGSLGGSGGTFGSAFRIVNGVRRSRGH